MLDSYIILRKSKYEYEWEIEWIWCDMYIKWYNENKKRYIIKSNVEFNFVITY